MADIELDLEDDLIAVDDHDRQQRLMASRNAGTWRVFEGPIDGPQALSKRATAETPTQVLTEALRWLADGDVPPLFACERYLEGGVDAVESPVPEDVDPTTAHVEVLFPNGDRVTIHPDRVAIVDETVRVAIPEDLHGDLKITFDST